MAKIMPSLKNSPTRKKQVMMAGGIGALIVAIALGAAWFADGGNKRPARSADKKSEQVSLSLPIPGQQINDKDVWRANEASKIESLNKQLAEIKQNMLTPPKVAGSPAAGAVLGGAGMNEVPMPPAPPSLPQGANLRPLPMRAGALPPPPPLPPQAFPQPGAGRPGIPGQAGTDPNTPVIKRTFSLEVSSDPATPAVTAVQSASKSAESKEEHRSAENYLPAGTFMRVVLLAGLDAPTGGQAQNNPHPILMRVLDPAQLPNRYLADMKDCVITANGYGDISSERAYIRTDRMSCIDQQGGAVDVALKGYAAGEDGKAGMRGRLVSKQGQALANAFLAGIGSGIGQAFKDSASTNSISPLGATSTITDGKELQAGLSSGVGSAMAQLSKYYIKLAEQVFPVIEIDGGRVVDVVLTRGLSIDRR
jgi:conjugal transfer pilus assembly protein TraB